MLQSVKAIFLYFRHIRAITRKGEGFSLDFGLDGSLNELERGGWEGCMTGKTDIERFAYVCLLVSAFGTGFSILVGRVFMALAVVFLIVNLARERKRPIVTATGWLALLFFLIAVVATAQGVDPAAGFAKIDRLLWFAGIPVTAMLVTSWQRLASVLKAYAFGTGVKALLTIAWNPVMAMQDISVGKQFNFMASLIDKGSMTYAQALVLGMVISLAFLFICRLE